MIQIRPNAEKEFRRLLNKSTHHPLFLHLTVVSGGCFEWTYQLTVTNTYNPKQETPHTYKDFTLVIPQSVGSYLQDLTIDYAEDLMGGGFRFINSQAQQTCGCGNSFTLEASVQADSTPSDCTQVDWQNQFKGN